MKLETVMNLLADREFGVLYFTPERVLGAVFTFRNRRWVLQHFAKADENPEDPSAASKQVCREINCSRGMRLLISGALENGVLLSFDSVNMPAKDRRNAIEMDLPRLVPTVPDPHQLQFVDMPGAGTDGACRVNAYLIPADSVKKLVRHITRMERKVDGYCYPLLGVSPTDGALFIPALEPDFCFIHGRWCPREGHEQKIAEGLSFWQAEFSRCFLLPEQDFSVEEFLPLLLVARLAVSPRFRQLRNGMTILPDKVRQVRYKGSLRIMALLIALLVLVKLISTIAIWCENYREFSQLNTQLSSLKQKISENQSKTRRGTKDRKERARIAGMALGEHDILGKMYDLAKVLPSNVRVVNMRWDEDSLNLMLNSETENINIPAVMEPLRYWKVDQVHQRQGFNSSAVTINVKLESADKVSKERKKK